jgi:hypothetical protein
MAKVFHLKNGESLKDTPHIEEMPFEEVTDKYGTNWKYLGLSIENLSLSVEGERIKDWASRVHVVAEIQPEEAGPYPTKPGFYVKE